MVGLREIGRRLGVAPQTPAKWRARGLLPELVCYLGGKPVWRWGEIERWARGTGRLRGESCPLCGGRGTLT